MPQIKFDSKAPRAVANALAPYANSMFDSQTGEWVAVVRLGHAARSETVKTDDDTDYLETAVKLTLLDAEVVTGPFLAAVQEAMDGARRQRETAGTLLDDAFRGDGE